MSPTLSVNAGAARPGKEMQIILAVHGFCIEQIRHA